MSLEKYNPSDGLTQDEFRAFLELQQKYHKDRRLLDFVDTCVYTDLLEKIVESRATQIKELNQELLNDYDKRSKKK